MVLHSFLEATSLHGWGFMIPRDSIVSGEKGGLIAKIFWALILFGSYSAAIFAVFTTVAEFQDATVLLNLESPSVPMDDIQFPSVLLCDTKVMRESFVYR